MDQIREQVTTVLDRQGVLSRLKAELRANVFLAINDQDVRQGGIGLASKTDATHRTQLAADPTGVLLVELVREFLQWCDLQFTHKVYEQEMQIGPAAGRDALLQQLGSIINAALDQPLLLQVLKQQLQGSGWQAAVQESGEAQHTNSVPDAAAQTGAYHVLHGRQLHAHAATADTPASEAEAAAAQMQGDLFAEPVSVPVGKAPSTSLSMGEVSVGEDSGLIGTQMHAEEEEEYATALLPAHRSSTDEGLEADASSTSSTFPVDTPRLTARPTRALAAAQPEAPLPPVQHPAGQAPLPPLAAARPAEPPAAAAAYSTPDWHTSGDAGGMAAACELSESFGHDRSFGDSSLELRGLESPTQAPAQHPAASGIDPEASYSSSASSSRASSSSGRRVGSNRGGSSAYGPSHAAHDVEFAAAGQAQVAAGAAQEPSTQPAHLQPLPALRGPGKLAPLPAVSSSGLPKRASEGIRDELLKSGLLAPSVHQHEDTPPPAATAAAGLAAVSSPAAEASSEDLAGSDSQEALFAGAAEAGPAAVPQSQRTAGAWRSMLSHTETDEDSDRDSKQDSEEDSDDFGMPGQQQLLQAARRQLSNKSSRSSLANGSGEQQQSQQAPASGVMNVQMSGASLTLIVSDVDEDSGMIPDDISLPLDALMDGSDDSEVYAAAQSAGPVASTAAPSAQPQAWATSARAPVVTVAAAQPGGFTARFGHNALVQALDLTDTDSEGDSQDYDQPLAAAGGFVIDDDDF